MVLTDSPGGVLVLERQQIASNHLFGAVDNTLQSALVLGSCSSVPDGDEEVRMDLMWWCRSATVIDFGRLNFFSCCRKYILC